MSKNRFSSYGRLNRRWLKEEEYKKKGGKKMDKEIEDYRISLVKKTLKVGSCSTILIKTKYLQTSKSCPEFLKMKLFNII